jgi:hypothetical protein
MASPLFPAAPVRGATPLDGPTPRARCMIDSKHWRVFWIVLAAIILFCVAVDFDQGLLGATSKETSKRKPASTSIMFRGRHFTPKHGSTGFAVSDGSVLKQPRNLLAGEDRASSAAGGRQITPHTIAAMKSISIAADPSQPVMEKMGV